MPVRIAKKWQTHDRVCQRRWSEDSAAIRWTACNQKVKRAPPWNWRGEFTVEVISPKGVLELE